MQGVLRGCSSRLPSPSLPALVAGRLAATNHGEASRLRERKRCNHPPAAILAILDVVGMAGLSGVRGHASGLLVDGLQASVVGSGNRLGGPRSVSKRIRKRIEGI